MIKLKDSIYMPSVKNIERDRELYVLEMKAYLDKLKENKFGENKPGNKEAFSERGFSITRAYEE